MIAGRSLTTRILTSVRGAAWAAVFAGAALAMTGAPAAAQSAQCERARAELASLPAGGGGGNVGAQGARIRSELGRLQAQFNQLDCGRGFSFFGPSRPPQCSAIEGRIASLRSAYGSLQAQGGSDVRRRQLTAWINQNCGQQREGNFFERLFGVQPQAPQAPAAHDRGYEMNRTDQIIEGPQRFGGSRVVCVRACDGLFFPLPSNRREGAEDMCQALCPATQTLVYFMSGDGAIERAGNREGRPYTELPNAGKYKKTVDPSCSCLKPGEQWATALQPAETMVKSGRGDFIVSEEKAEELSRPLQPRPTRAAKAPEKAPEPAVTETDDEAAVDPSSLPTASNESAGIGPQTIDETQRTVGTREGQFRETVGAGGGKATVRVVAPNIFASPTEELRAR